MTSFVMRQFILVFAEQGCIKFSGQNLLELQTSEPNEVVTSLLPIDDSHSQSQVTQNTNASTKVVDSSLKNDEADQSDSKIEDDDQLIKHIEVPTPNHSMMTKMRELRLVSPTKLERSPSSVGFI